MSGLLLIRRGELVYIDCRALLLLPNVSNRGSDGGTLISGTTVLSLVVPVLLLLGVIRGSGILALIQI
jgi:hypothetical protein